MVVILALLFMVAAVVILVLRHADDPMIAATPPPQEITVPNEPDLQGASESPESSDGEQSPSEGFEGALAIAQNMADRLCFREDEVECNGSGDGVVFFGSELLDQLDLMKKRYPVEMLQARSRDFLASLKERVSKENLGSGSQPDRKLTLPEVEERDHLLESLVRYDH